MFITADHQYCACVLDLGNLSLLFCTCRSLESCLISPDPFSAEKSGRNKPANNKYSFFINRLLTFARRLARLRQSLQTPILRTNLTHQLQTNSKYVANRLFLCYFKNSLWISILNSFLILCLKTGFTFYMAKLHFKSKTVPLSF